MNTLPLEVQRRIKAEVERNACPEHGKHPTVTFTSNGIDVKSCCIRFERIMAKVAGDAVYDYINQEAIKAFKGGK